MTPAVAVAVHVKVVPAMLEVSVTRVVLPPEQIVWVSGVLVTVGLVHSKVIVAVPVLLDSFPALSMATKLIVTVGVPFTGSTAMVWVGLPDPSVVTVTPPGGNVPDV